MKTRSFPTGYRCSLALLLALLTVNLLDAATLSVSPPAIGNEFRGVVTVQIDGLPAGETVVLRKYADLNSNGAIDATDMLMESFQLTDGFATTIGGVTNYNIPYDSAATTGAITTSLPFFSTDTIRHIVGGYLFRVSSPGGGFAPVTSGFTVTNAPHVERITGTVRSGAAGLPGSIVVLLTPPPDQNVVAGTIADLNGNYTLAIAPGTYQMLGFQRGYVGDFSGSPVVTVNTGQTITTNINLILAPRTITGRVVNTSNASIGPPGVILFAQSDTGSYTLGSTDTNGAFSLAVTADLWQVEPQGEDLTAHGYLGKFDWPLVDTSAGNATNALIPVSYGTAMFHGRIRDDSGVPLPGVRFYANDDLDQSEGGGQSDLNGNYAVPVMAGSWRLSADSENPDLAGYVVAGTTNATLATGQTIRADFTTTRATGTIRGSVRNNLGIPIPDLSVYCYALINGATYVSSVNTDASGNYSLDVITGVWNVGLSCEGDEGLPSLGYNCVGEQRVQVPPNNATADFVVDPIGTPSLSSPALFGGGLFQFQLFGAPGTNYTVQFSTNLSSWTTLTVTNLSDSSIFLQDNRATNRQRFYRAFTGP